MSSTHPQPWRRGGFEGVPSRNGDPLAIEVADGPAKGMSDANMRKLTREVEAGCRRFWAKRGMREPSEGGWKAGGRAERHAKKDEAL